MLRVHRRSQKTYLGAGLVPQIPMDAIQPGMIGSFEGADQVPCSVVNCKGGGGLR